MSGPREQRGDTIIEVVMAVTVFSLLAVGVMALMNRGIAMAQRSLELTLVRQQIDAQSEILRYIHDMSMQGHEMYVNIWKTITEQQTDRVNSVLGAAQCPKSMPARGFSLTQIGDGLRLVTQHYVQPPTYARVALRDAVKSEGIAIQLVRVENGGAYDAYIQACWMSVGSDRPMTTGTIVRIYDAKA